MKFRRFLFVFLISLAAFQFCLSQEKPKAVLIDEFDSVSCDELSLRVDKLFLALTNNSSSKGYIVISGYKDEPIKKYFYAEKIKGYASWRKLDKNRFVFIFNNAEEVRTQLWLVPNNADVSAFAHETDNHKLPQTFKPTLIHKSSWISDGCPEGFSYELYSKFLQANPNVLGNLVIYYKSVNGLRRIKNDLLNKLAKQYKVPHSQLKFFSVKRKNPDVEFWFVPKKRK